MPSALKVEGLCKSYGPLLAVDNLSFEVAKGETFGLLGHNGAGKSTVIECILGIKRADQGLVNVLEMNPVTQRKQLFQRVGVQFQHMNYQDKITVGEICEVTNSLYNNPYHWHELLKMFRLSDKKKQMVSELSGGERQRLSVLLALIPNPELVFLRLLASIFYLC